VLAILTSHPIQYQAPIWRALAASGRTPFEVWFLTDHGATSRSDAEFGRTFQWDVDLLDGYPHQYLQVEAGWTLKSFRGITLQESLRERMRALGVTALWVEGWRFKPFWDAVKDARSTGAEVWMRGESNDLRRNGWLKSLAKRAVLSRHLSRVDRFLAIGSANRRFYESYGARNSQLHPTPYCVDNDRFAAQAAELQPRRRDIRDRWKIGDDALCVLFCGKFIDKKRPCDVIAAVNQLSRGEGRQPVHLLFVGSGALGGAMRQQCEVMFDAEACAAAGLGSTSAPSSRGPRASFAGFMNQSEIAQAYVAADVLVLPSDHGETWGLVVNEAMACGTPAIVSDQCGCAEDLAARVDPRLVFRCGDVEHLAQAVEHLQSHRPAVETVRAVVDAHHLRHTVETVDRLYAAISTGQRTESLT
jgi:glycosyltransferase involved in cell wall biosynthesis